MLLHLPDEFTIKNIETYAHINNRIISSKLYHALCEKYLIGDNSTMKINSEVCSSELSNLAIGKDNLTIKVKYINNSIPRLKLNAKGDYVDLYTAEGVTLKQFESTLISLGVSMKLPEGYYALMCPRSSTFTKWGVIQTNSIGIIDNSYSGDNDVWRFPALAMRDTVIPKGTRLCQFTLMPIIKPTFEEVVHLTIENRGGFGSTGD